MKRICEFTSREVCQLFAVVFIIVWVFLFVLVFPHCLVVVKSWSFTLCISRGSDIILERGRSVLVLEHSRSVLV